MKTTRQRFPQLISKYIKDHFHEDFLFEVKAVQQLKGNWYYIVEVTKDNHIHKLIFNEEGQLVKDEVEQAFPPDQHDEAALEDTLE